MSLGIMAATTLSWQYWWTYFETKRTAAGSAVGLGGSAAGSGSYGSGGGAGGGSAARVPELEARGLASPAKQVVLKLLEQVGIPLHFPPFLSAFKIQNGGNWNKTSLPPPTSS